MICFAIYELLFRCAKQKCSLFFLIVILADFFFIEFWLTAIRIRIREAEMKRIRNTNLDIKCLLFSPGCLVWSWGSRYGCMKWKLDILPHPHYILILIFFPKSPFFSSTPDILPNSHDIIGKMILLPLSLFSTLYSSPQPWFDIPFPSHNLIFFPNK